MMMIMLLLMARTTDATTAINDDNDNRRCARNGNANVFVSFITHFSYLSILWLPSSSAPISISIFFFVVVAVVLVSILFFNLYVFLWCNNLLDFFRLMASTCLANDAQHIASQTNVCLQVLTRQPIYLRF